MALTPVNVEQFGGLNLAMDPEEVGLAGAIDILNVSLDRRGRIRSRPGSSKLGSDAGSLGSAPGLIVPWNGALAFVAQVGADITLFGTSGGSNGTQTGKTMTGAAALGTGAAGPYMYVACGYSDTIQRVTSAGSWSAPAGMPAVEIITVQQPDNRLVAANSTGLASRVKFSDAGAPETWGANNYVDLRPNDGEEILWAVGWRELVIVSKMTSAYVFYGNSTDSSGNPVFNYRPISVPHQNIGAFRNQAVGHRTGVYFTAIDGFYRTTGGDAVKISTALDPVFSTGTSFFASGATVSSTWRPAANGDCVYFPVVMSDASYMVFVYDTVLDTWSAWSLAAGSLFLAGVNNVLLYSFASGSNAIAKVSESVASDAGTTFTSRYRSGFGDLGLPGREKTVRQTELVGQGTVSMGWSRDMGAITNSSTANVTLGTAPATTRGMHRLAQNGELLSWQVSSVSGGAWQLNRLEPFVRRPRNPGEKSA